MMRYTVRYSACTSCSKRIRLGRRRFGPSQVRCGHCNEIVQTGLEQWANLPTGRKITVAIGEILVPSWISIPGCEGIVITALVQVTLWFVCAMPLMIPGMSLSSKNAFLGSALAVLGLLVYPGLMAMRLRKMVRESNASTTSGTIPIWK
jgi:hypothetical protein